MHMRRMVWSAVAALALAATGAAVPAQAAGNGATADAALSPSSTRPVSGVR